MVGLVAWFVGGELICICLLPCWHLLFLMWLGVVLLQPSCCSCVFFYVTIVEDFLLGKDGKLFSGNWYINLFYLARLVMLLTCYHLALGFSTKFYAVTRVMVLIFSSFSFVDQNMLMSPTGQ